MRKRGISIVPSIFMLGLFLAAFGFVWTMSGQAIIKEVRSSTSVQELDNRFEWIRYPGNPILVKNESNLWESVGVVSPKILKYTTGLPYRDSLGRYFLYYDGMSYDYDLSGTRYISFDQIGLAFSKDLISWQRHSDNPVLPAGVKSEDYDHGDTQIGTVLVDNGVFKMWYNANSKNKSQGGDNVTIGYAESHNGINWIKYPTPVLKQGILGDFGDLYSPTVIKDGNLWKMWYVGHNSTTGGAYRIMYATSFDGINWEKYSEYYIFDPGYNVFVNEVYKLNNKYYMLFVNWNNPKEKPIEIHLASSLDGISWVYEKKVFSVSSSGSWDDDLVYWPSQIYTNKKWYTFYSGVNEDIPSWSIGLATSVTRVP